MSEIRYVDLAALTYYDGKLRSWVGTKDTEVLNRSKVTITKLTTPTTGSAATFEVFQNYTTAEGVNTPVSIGKIEIPLDKFVSAGAVVDHVFATGEAAKKAIELTVSNGDNVFIDISGIAGDITALTTRVSNLEAQVGKDKTVAAYESKNDLVDIVNVLTADNATTGSVKKQIKDAVEALDTQADIALATTSEGVVTIKAVKEVDGVIAASADTALDVTLAKVATTGTAADVAVVDAADKITATDVEAALLEIVNKADANTATLGDMTQVKTTAKTVAGAVDELKDAIDTLDSDSEVYLDVAETATEGFLKTYVLSQGKDAEGKKIEVGKIDIPKDFLVKSAELKTVETENVPYTGAKVGDKYIDFVINTKDASATDEHLYLPCNDLFDSYTSGSTADSQVIVTVDNDTNKISAVIGAGKVGTTELTDAAVTNAKIADATIARAKIDTAFETDLAAIEAAIGTVGEGEAAALYAVAARIKAEAENADYTPATGSKTTIQAAIRALEASATDTNGAFVFKGSVANKAALPTDAKKGDAYLATDINTLFICTTSAVADPATNAVYTQLAANGTFSVGNDTLAHDVDVKAYIDSRIYVGTQSEVDAAKAAGTIDDTTFVVVTDADSQELKPVQNSEIDALFA